MSDRNATVITIRVDPTIDDGVYVCPPCVRQHDWRTVPVNLELDDDVIIPLCYNCHRPAVFHVKDEIVGILEDLRIMKLRLNDTDDDYLFTQYRDAPYDLIAKALRRMVEHVYPDTVSDSLIEASYDYSRDETFDWNGRANSLRDIVLDWTY